MDYRNGNSSISNKDKFRYKLTGLLLSLDLTLLIILLQSLNELARLKNIIRMIE
ncbi:hypothetical protein SDC9_121417 [bioreactor metagenome]|uniref:Uncharacterized protein n=1 Tax=bioreactor metagenome TaxID=1076179 RepID=A0A645CBX1_9ZZZZ|nr:hypothetical protein [Sedimentibacter sp.]